MFQLVYSCRGLIANVSLSLTHPFVYVGADLLAQASSSSSSSGTGQVELCSASVTCTPQPIPSSVSCKGYDPDYTCKSNQLYFWVECDGKRHTCENI